MTYLTEWPTWATSDMPALPAGWIDQSWRHDLMPHFVNPELGLGLWVDHSDPALASWPQEDRFLLQGIDNEGSWDGINETQFFSSDWAAIAARIADAQDELDAQTKCVTHTDTGRGVCADCGAFL
tara:strand:- start:705 stop:1079 length:375 start_codon:yes stop_codon:yes gene_type:complete